MTNLSTKYLGIPLKNPVVVSSSGMSNSVEKVEKLAENGAGAVVLKSLFEEQIKYESGNLEQHSNYPEASDYILNYTRNNTVDQYLDLIDGCKKKVNIPIIPSINCVTSDEWIDFAKKVESAGADALEVNIFLLPQDKKRNSADYEKIYIETAENIVNKLNIPVAVKLGRNFTNPSYVVDQLQSRGVKGVVLFNRFYEPDIDVETMKIVSAEVFSTPADIRQSLRWVGIMSSLNINIDIAASTGIHSGNDVVKQLLAGANVTMLCSSLYKQGAEHIKSVLDQLEFWMEKNNYDTIEGFRGKLSYKDIPDPSLYERSQFMKYFSSIQ